MNDALPDPPFLSQVTLRGDEKCPCTSGKWVQSCCLQPDGSVRKLYHGVLPAGSPTGFAHPDCYLKESRDCSRKLSAEHYFSLNVMQALVKAGEKAMRMSGVSWMPIGEERLVGLQSLTAKILCRRHNSLLSPLDSGAGALAKVFARAFDGDATYNSDMLVLASGPAFEAWLIKAALGGLYAGTFRDENGVPITKERVSFDAVWPALRGNPLPPGCGMYILAGGIFTQGWPALKARALTMRWKGERYFCGADICLSDVNFRVILDPEATEIIDSNEGWSFRPHLLELRRPDSVSTLKFDWPSSMSDGQNVRVDLRSVPFGTWGG